MKRKKREDNEVFHISDEGTVDSENDPKDIKRYEFWQEKSVEKPEKTTVYEAVVFGKKKKTDSEVIEERIRKREPSFPDVLRRLCNEKIEREPGLTDADIYNKAHISRSTFCRMLGHDDFKVRKRLILILCISMHLSVEEAEELLQSKGYCLSKSVKSDIIIRYCLENGIYEEDRIDDFLREFKQEPLYDRSID